MGKICTSPLALTTKQWSPMRTILKGKLHSEGNFGCEGSLGADVTPLGPLCHWELFCVVIRCPWPEMRSPWRRRWSKNWRLKTFLWRKRKTFCCLSFHLRWFQSFGRTHGNKDCVCFHNKFFIIGGLLLLTVQFIVRFIVKSLTAVITKSEIFPVVKGTFWLIANSLDLKTEEVLL